MEAVTFGWYPVLVMSEVESNMTWVALLYGIFERLDFGVRWPLVRLLDLLFIIDVE